MKSQKESWEYIESRILFEEVNKILEKYGSVLPKMEFAPDRSRAVNIRIENDKLPILRAYSHHSPLEIFNFFPLHRFGGIPHPYANRRVFETLQDGEWCLVGRYPEVGDLLYYLDYYCEKANLLFPSEGFRTELLLPEGELREKVAAITEKTSPAQYYSFLASLAEQHVDKFHIQLLGPRLDKICEFFNASELDPIHVYLSRKGEEIRILRTGKKPIDLFLKNEPEPISI